MVANRVCAGELRQVCERGNLALSEADYFAIIEGKTAALTECCGRLGALYAGASEEVAGRLASYGRSVGLAFQIADDLLDVEGSAEEIGKTSGKDAASGKATMVAVLGVDMARAHADMLARQAADHLEEFGDRAANLRALAAFVVTRRS